MVYEKIFVVSFVEVVCHSFLAYLTIGPMQSIEVWGMKVLTGIDAESQFSLFLSLHKGKMIH